MLAVQGYVISVVSEPYHITFKVLPRDESRSKVACELLVRQIESVTV